ncbi:Hypothetical protein I596_442 [Dokdonella koreensis DS-123]|uniref:Uncharacterized protein n=1 Tax=Dokdonella koreensis DS-123 TaxID=1300342 RepID=A0A167GEU1_9GAMM|nr:Hypothetical protein I596_442 [Dokdonella koreensis DS-123]
MAVPAGARRGRRASACGGDGPKDGIRASPARSGTVIVWSGNPASVAQLTLSSPSRPRTPRCVKAPAPRDAVPGRRSGPAGHHAAAGHDGD